MRFKSQTRLLNRNGKNDENKTWSFPKLGGISRWYANELLRGILISLLSRSDSFDPSIDSSGSFYIFFFSWNQKGREECVFRFERSPGIERLDPEPEGSFILNPWSGGTNLAFGSHICSLGISILLLKSPFEIPDWSVIHWLSPFV